MKKPTLLSAGFYDWAQKVLIELLLCQYYFIDVSETFWTKPPVQVTAC